MPYQSNYLPYNMPTDTAMRQRIFDRLLYGTSHPSDRDLYDAERTALRDLQAAIRETIDNLRDD